MLGSRCAGGKDKMSLCLIFDLDGTLVDSECLCNQAFKEIIKDIDESVNNLIDRYKGKKLSLIFKDIENRYNIKLNNNIEEQYRKKVEELFYKYLKPMPGVEEMLKNITYPYCLASSGPIEKINQSLTICRLSKYFDPSKIFSSYVIGFWKPDPKLFLFAAKSMGFIPEKCIVIEDSETGINAAKAANMKYLQYCPNEILEYPNSQNKFNSMERLIELVKVFDNEET